MPAESADVERPLLLARRAARLVGPHHIWTKCTGSAGGRRVEPEGVVALGVHDARPGAHPLREPAVHDAGVAPGVLVHQRARQHPGDDLRVAVRMVGIAAPGRGPGPSLCTSSAPNDVLPGS